MTNQEPSSERPITASRLFLAYLTLVPNSIARSAAESASESARFALAFVGTRLGVVFLIASVALLVGLPIFWVFSVMWGVALMLSQAMILAVRLRPLRARAIPARPVVDPLATQISDLHLTAGPPLELRHNPALWPAGVSLPDMSARLGCLLAGLGKEGLPAIATGDLTDSGADEDWMLAMPLKQLSQTGLYVVPGNHDISIRTVRATASARVAELARNHHAARAWHYSMILSARGTPQPVARWQLRTANGANVHMILVDSNRRRSRWLASNAIGFLDRMTQDDLRAELDQCDGRVLLALHHHPSLTREDTADAARLQLAKEHFLGLLEAPSLLRELKHYVEKASGNEVLIIHGHRHVARFSELAPRIYVWGMPSSLLGNQRVVGVPGAPGRCMQHDAKMYYSVIGLDDQGHWGVDLRVVEAP